MIIIALFFTTIVRGQQPAVGSDSSRLQEEKLLEEVRVSTFRQNVIRKSDRYIVNIAGTYQSVGNSALDLFQRLPGIWVSHNGEIKLKGNLSVTVMINETVQRMSSEELAAYLQSLRSEDIASIEVITNPPAEYEAGGTGGIIRIVLKKKRNNGWSAVFNTQFKQQGIKDAWTGGLSATYKRDRLTLTASVSGTDDEKQLKERVFISGLSGEYYKNFTDRIDGMNNTQYRLGVLFDATARSSFGLQGTFTNTSFLQDYKTTEEQGSAISKINSLSATVKQRYFKMGSIAANYTLKLDSVGSTIKFLTEYSKNRKREFNLFSMRNLDSTSDVLQRTRAPVVTSILSLQSDYTARFKKGIVLLSGIKYVSSKRDNILEVEDFNNLQWTLDEAAGNRFIYDERLIMFYSSAEVKIKRVELKGGLRLEHTDASGYSPSIQLKSSRQYTSLFPSFFLQHVVNAERSRSIYFNYVRRLSRPSLSDLNPARIQYSAYTAMRGNPFLLPEYTNTVAVGYNINAEINTEVYFTHARNSIMLSANKGPGNSIDYWSENVRARNEAGFSISATLAVAKGWTSTNNFSLYQNHYRFNQTYYRQTSYYFRTVHNIILKRLMDIDVVLDYRSPYSYTNLRNPRNFYMDAGFSKRLLKNALRCRLSFTDVFNTLRERELTDDNGSHIDFYRKRPTRTVAISFSYSLGKS